MEIRTLAKTSLYKPMPALRHTKMKCYRAILTRLSKTKPCLSLFITESDNVYMSKAIIVNLNVVLFVNRGCTKDSMGNKDMLSDLKHFKITFENRH